MDCKFKTELGLVTVNDEVIVRAIVNLAHSLGLEVVGEGVETAGQLAILSEMGCRKVQGYWFSPAHSAQALQRLFEDRAQWPDAAAAAGAGENDLLAM